MADQTDHPDPEGAKVESQITMIGSVISKSVREVTMHELERERLTLEAMFPLPGLQLMDPFAIEPQLPLDDHARLRFWEVEGFFKCPVAGWCLDIPEQKEIVRKAGICTKGKSNLEIHEIVVKSLDDENGLSRKIDFWLNRKYQKEINELSSLEPGEFIQRWEASLKGGEFDGIVWVAVTKADLSPEVRRSIFGDLHMETHVRAKQLGNERQRLDQEQKRNERFAKSAKEASRINKILKRENEELKNQLGVACRLSDALQRQNQEMEKELSKVNENSLIVSLQKENAQLRGEKDGVLKQISTYQGDLRRLENQNNKLLSKLKKQQQIRFQRSNESVGSVKQISDSGLPDSAPSIDLSQKCVLVVGGLPKMEPLYRQLIERNKGIFEYHDGRVNTRPKELANQVRRAGLVLCCIDHSSHTSALIVKKLCKKYETPFRMLINSSLNNISLALLAFRNTLTTIQNGQEGIYDTPSGEVS